jgi:phosphoglycerate dehydrogenase-like enzyme
LFWVTESFRSKKEETLFSQDLLSALLKSSSFLSRSRIWVHSFTVGVDSICPVIRKMNKNIKNEENSRHRSVVLTNAKGAYSYSLAEYVFASIFYFNKQIPRLVNNLTNNNRQWDPFRMNVIKGKTVKTSFFNFLFSCLKIGLVGFGDIAKAIVPAAKIFGMKIIALRRQGKSEDGVSRCRKNIFLFFRLKFTTRTNPVIAKHIFFSLCDFVVCSLPSTPSTFHFCGKNEFEAMKPSAVFISIGRGACVDEVALFNALENEVRIFLLVFFPVSRRCCSGCLRARTTCLIITFVDVTGLKIIDELS